MPTIAMTCRSCKKPFKRRTRVGKFTTCPHCQEVQPGPKTNQEHSDQVAEQTAAEAAENKKRAARAAKAKERSRRNQPPKDNPAPSTTEGSTEIEKIETPPEVKEKQEPEERHAGILW